MLFRSLEQLKGDDKDYAKKMFGKINQIIADDNKKREILKYSILAFEKLRYSQHLSAIDKIDPSNFEVFKRMQFRQRNFLNLFQLCILATFFGGKQIIYRGQLYFFRAAFQVSTPPITMYLRLKARQPAVSFSASLPKLLE